MEAGYAGIFPLYAIWNTWEGPILSIRHRKPSRLMRIRFCSSFVENQGLVSVTQGIEILNGILYGVSTAISSDITISRDATLQLYGSPTDPDFSGNISGAGRVEKVGFNDLKLSGANSFTGGLLVDSGRVLGEASSLPGDIDLAGANSEVVFDQSQDGVHSGAITGLGRLTKRGTDTTLTLTGANSFLDDTRDERAGKDRQFRYTVWAGSILLS